MQLPQIIKFKDIKVLTTKQIAEAYGTTQDVIGYNFRYNKKRYLEGKHFIFLEGEELKKYKMTNVEIQRSLPRINKLYLWTEKGALLHAKSINTDKAWEVYDYLVDFYFRAKEEPRQQESVATSQPVNKPITAAVRPKAAAVVDIPINDKAQELIEGLNKNMAGIEAVIPLYNRYLLEENYQKVAYVLRNLCMNIAELGFQVMELKPGMIEKVL